MRTKAMVVEDSRPSPLALSSVSKADSGGICSASALRRRRWMKSSQRLPPLVHVDELRRIFVKCQIRYVVDLVVRNRQRRSGPEMLSAKWYPSFSADG